MAVVVDQLRDLADVAKPIGPAGTAVVVQPDGTFAYSHVGRAFTHIQGEPASVWTITHNLGTYPDVNVVDSAGTHGFGSVVYLGLNVLQITFASAFAGTALLRS